MRAFSEILSSGADQPSASDEAKVNMDQTTKTHIRNLMSDLAQTRRTVLHYSVQEVAGGRWMSGINDLSEATGLSNVADYTADLIVEQLDRDDTVLKSYILRNCFPVSTSAIDLSYDATTEVETFDITWRYTHFEASSVNF